MRMVLATRSSNLSQTRFFGSNYPRRCSSSGYWRSIGRWRDSCCHAARNGPRFALGHSNQQPSDGSLLCVLVSSSCMVYRSTYAGGTGTCVRRNGTEQWRQVNLLCDHVTEDLSILPWLGGQRTIRGCKLKYCQAPGNNSGVDRTHSDNNISAADSCDRITVLCCVYPGRRSARSFKRS